MEFRDMQEQSTFHAGREYERKIQAKRPTMNEIEAIELLEKLRALTSHNCIGKIDAREAESKCSACLANQALAKLREKPEPTAFTKECRALRLKGVTPEQWEYAEKLGQACIYIDQLQAKERTRENDR